MRDVFGLPSSIQQPERDSVLACAAKAKQACGGAHATMHAVALIYTPRVVVNRVLREVLRFFDWEKKHGQHATRYVVVIRYVVKTGEM